MRRCTAIGPNGVLRKILANVPFAHLKVDPIRHIQAQSYNFGVALKIDDLRELRNRIEKSPQKKKFGKALTAVYNYCKDGIWALAACAALASFSSLAAREADSGDEISSFNFSRYASELIASLHATQIDPESEEPVIYGDEEAASAFTQPEEQQLAFADVEITSDPGQLEVPDRPQEQPWQVYRIARNDTLGRILGKIADDREATNFLVTQKFKVYRRLRRGQPIEYRLDENGKIQSLRYKASADLIFEFERNDGHNMSALERTPDLSARIAAKHGKITSTHNSLFAATDHAQVPDSIIHGVISALETRVDFARSTRLGDNFTLVYEELLDEDGIYAAAGQLLGFSWINRNKEIIGLYNADEGGFFEPDGTSVQRAFLRSPLKFSRISSKFTNRRFHPVLKKWRAHRGVDFAAPRGTPVRASGDGRITFRGRKGGYGNTVIIEHFGKYTTLYAHLSKFHRKATKGSQVAQGQIIGYVGSTGLSTGPHLHYEFRIDGKHQDPLSAKVPTRRPPLTGEALAQFQQKTSSILSTIRAGQAEVLQAKSQ